MSIVTAKAAGVPHVVACTPPIQGELPYATIAAMPFAGADDIFILGGVQAVAGMAIGTETISKVDFIAGPGNSFVAEAKRQLFGEIGIDLPAGPTEVLIVADDKADPFTIATDLLSQAEHGPDTPAVLITTSRKVGEEAIKEVDRQLQILPTAPIASISWGRLGEVVLVDSLDEAYTLADQYASEHVQILTERPRVALEKMTTYGALFLGKGTCVSYGDKVSGFISMYSSMVSSCADNRSSTSVSERTTSSPPRVQPASQAACGLVSILRRSPIKRSLPTVPALSLAACVVGQHERRSSKATQGQET